MGRGTNLSTKENKKTKSEGDTFKIPESVVPTLSLFPFPVPEHWLLCNWYSETVSNSFSSCSPDYSDDGGTKNEQTEIDVNNPSPIIPDLLDSDDNYMNGGSGQRRQVRGERERRKRREFPWLAVADYILQCVSMYGDFFFSVGILETEIVITTSAFWRLVVVWGWSPVTVRQYVFSGCF